MNVSQEEKVLSGIGHLSLLFGWLALLYNLVVWFMYREKSKFVAGHVKQALGLWVLVTAVQLVLTFLVTGTAFLSTRSPGALFGGISLTLIIWLVTAVMTVIAAIRGFSGQEYRHPVIGDMIARVGE